MPKHLLLEIDILTLENENQSLTKVNEECRQETYNFQFLHNFNNQLFFPFLKQINCDHGTEYHSTTYMQKLLPLANYFSGISSMMLSGTLVLSRCPRRVMAPFTLLHLLGALSDHGGDSAIEQIPSISTWNNIEIYWPFRGPSDCYFY